MKQSFAFTALTALTISLTSFTSQSQDAWTAINIRPSLISSSSRAMIASEESDRKAIESLKGMNSRMFEDFSKNFSNATNISTQVVDKSVLVNFTQDDVRTRVCYTSKGRWMNTLKFLSAEQIPEHIRDAVTDYYPRYEVTRGQQVIAGPKSAWLIDLESKTGYKTIRLLDGQMDVYREFEKQK